MFVKYLVSNNFISKTNLIHAVAKVSESQPSLIRVLIDENIISEDQAVSAIEKQIELNLSIAEVLVKENIVSRDKLNQAITIMNDSGKTLIDILLEDRIIEYASLADAIEKYKTESCNVIEEPKKENKSASISEAALESLKELGISDEEMISELESGTVKAQKASVEEIPIEEVSRINEQSDLGDNVFAQELIKSMDEKQFGKLLKIATIIEQAVETEGDVNTYLNTLYKDFHIIKGAACLAEVREIENLLDRWEEVLEKLFNLSENEIRNWFSSKGEIVAQTVDILKKIKENLENKHAMNEGVEENYSQVLSLLVA